MLKRSQWVQIWCGPCGREDVNGFFWENPIHCGCKATTTTASLCTEGAWQFASKASAHSSMHGAWAAPSMHEMKINVDAGLGHSLACAAAISIDSLGACFASCGWASRHSRLWNNWGRGLLRSARPRSWKSWPISSLADCCFTLNGDLL